MLSRVDPSVFATVVVILVHASPLIFNSFLGLVLAVVVELVLPLPVFLKCVKPILPIVVVCGPTVLNIGCEVCCVRGNVYLPV